jgi:hypothetical protein
VVIGMSDQDAYQRACEKYAARCAEMRAEEEELQELQAQLAQQRQRSSEALVYKTFATPAPQRSNSNSMDPVTEAAWNEWADRKIETALRHQSEWMKHSIAEAFVLERQSMREEIGSLRAEVEILRGVVKSNNIELIRKTNAA